jgi:Rrf2 family protein
MRLEITRRTELALRALRALERDGGTMKASKLATDLGSTSQYLPHVLRPMVQAGWLSSEPGPSGGYRLAEPLGGLSLLELIELIGGPTNTGSCVLRGGECGTTECALHTPWMEARDALLEQLAAVSISGPEGARL